MISSDVLLEKCVQLDPLERETVEEFIDFLLSKHALSRDNAQQALLDISVWSDDDIASIEQVQQDMAQWPIPTFS
jgi:hypothetical protein